MEAADILVLSEYDLTKTESLCDVCGVLRSFDRESAPAHRARMCATCYAAIFPDVARLARPPVLVAASHGGPRS